MPSRRLFTACALAFACSLIPTSARADVLLTPFVGGNFGGSASAPLAEVVGNPSRTAFGGSVAFMSNGIFGLEADLGYTPKFFGTDLELGGVPINVARNNVLTAMVNLTAGVPLQGRSGAGVRPYAVGGIGVIRQQFNLVGGLAGYGANDLGYDVGGGVMIFVAPNVGIRGDVRHFRTVGGNTLIDLLDLQPGAFNFTRATIGVTFRY
jgi:opacity protein-like surface antigen